MVPNYGMNRSSGAGPLGRARAFDAVLASTSVHFARFWSSWTKNTSRPVAPCIALSVAQKKATDRFLSATVIPRATPTRGIGTRK